MERGSALRAGSIAADGTPRIDGHLNQSGDIAYVDGHYYAAKAPGLAMFSVPAYVVADALGAIPLGPPTSPPEGAHTLDGKPMWYANLVVVGAFLCLLLLIRWVVDRSIGTAGTRVALMLGLGTLLLPYATAYFAHDLAAALGFAAFAFAVYTKPTRPDIALVGAGVLGGLAVVVELPAVIVTVAVAETSRCIARTYDVLPPSPPVHSSGSRPSSCSTPGLSGRPYARATRTR